MNLSPWGRPASRGAVVGAGIVATVLAVEAAVVGLLFRVEQSRLEREASRSFVRDGPVSDRYEFTAEGVRRPPVRIARDARLPDAEDVIGVVVGGRARAYRVAAMRPTNAHVLNDLVAGVPVTVTYCDLTDCARGFTDPGANTPLGVEQGGLKGGRMVLKVGGAFYLQDTGEPLEPGPPGARFPYEEVAVTRTSWGSWREWHPDSEIFTGPGDEGGGEARAGSPPKGPSPQKID